MTQLQLEILLLLPFGIFLIKAIQALTEEGNLLWGWVAWIEREIEFLTTQLIELNKTVEDINNNKDIGLNLSQTKHKAQDQIEKFNVRLSLFLLLTKPLYRCSICMSSIWGSLTWLWWVNLSPLPIATWPAFCLMLCGAMYMYENRYEHHTDVYVKNIINPDQIEEDE